MRKRKKKEKKIKKTKGGKKKSEVCFLGSSPFRFKTQSKTVFFFSAATVFLFCCCTFFFIIIFCLFDSLSEIGRASCRERV